MTATFLIEAIDCDAPLLRLTKDDDVFFASMDVLFDSPARFSMESIESLVATSSATFFLEPIDVDTPPEQDPKVTKDDELVIHDPVELHTTITELLDSVQKRRCRSKTKKERVERRSEQRRMPTAKAKAKEGRDRRKTNKSILRQRWIDCEREWRAYVMRCLPHARNVQEKQLCLRYLERSDAVLSHARELCPKALRESLNAAFKSFREELCDVAAAYFRV